MWLDEVWRMWRLRRIRTIQWNSVMTSLRYEMRVILPVITCSDILLYDDLFLSSKDNCVSDNIWMNGVLSSLGIITLVVLSWWSIRCRGTVKPQLPLYVGSFPKLEVVEVFKLHGHVLYFTVSPLEDLNWLKQPDDGGVGVFKSHKNYCNFYSFS